MSLSYLDKIVGKHAFLAFELSFPPASVQPFDVCDYFSGFNCQFVGKLGVVVELDLNLYESVLRSI